jgi:hypothetical protein
MPIQNVEELRDFLAQELDRVREGKATPASANASANLAGKILSSVKLELEHNKMAGATPNIGFLGKSTKNKLKQLEEKDEK